jgi:cytochrome c oxidase subunit 2
MRRRVLVLAGATALLASSCMPQAATTQGQSTFNLYQVFFWAGAVVAAIVWILTTFAVLRYRRRGDARSDALPSQVRDNGRLELLWTGLPVLTVGVLFVFTVLTLNTVDAMAPNPDVTVDVVAFRWSWQFTYAGQGVVVDGDSTHVPELVVPAGQTVHIVLTSADVAHAFWVPAFLFKRDAIPGITNQFDFNVKQPGTWTGQCAEYCGLYHDQMTFVVRAMPAPQFDAWLAARRAAGSPGPSGAVPSSPASSAQGSSPPASSPALASPSSQSSPSTSSPGASSASAGSPS